MTPITPVKATSGAGFAAEDHFGTYLAVALLAQKPIAGSLHGHPVRIDFQVGVDNWHLDDVLVLFRSNGRQVRLPVSIKSYAQIKNTASEEFVLASWKDMSNADNSPFDLSHDLLGLVTTTLSETTMENLNILINFAKEQDIADLDRRINQEGYVGRNKRHLWTSFSAPKDFKLPQYLTASPAELLKRLIYFQDDLLSSSSSLQAQTMQWCNDICGGSKPASQLKNAILAEVHTVRIAGGFLDETKLIARLDEVHKVSIHKTHRPSYITQLTEKSKGRLISRWQAVNVPRDIAITLAEDTTVGNINSEFPDRGLFALIGPMGSGKSVAAERLHQADLSTYLNNPDKAIPIFCRARDINHSLENTIDNKVLSLHRSHMSTISLIIDGLDEVSPKRATEIISDARSITNAVPDTRIIFTSRPGPLLNEDEIIQTKELSDEELEQLSLLLTGYRHNLISVPEPIKRTLRYPLFAIIAIVFFQSKELPSNNALLIKTLVDNALHDRLSDTIQLFDTLTQTASVAIRGNGNLSAWDLGGVGQAAAIEDLQIIVTDAAGYHFSLPIFEQYFGALYLLDGNSNLDDIFEDLPAFELWRYSCVTAIGIGGWNDLDRIISYLGARWPGAACWVVDQAISEYAVGAGPHSRSANVNDMASRLRYCLDTVSSWLGKITPYMGLLDQEGQLKPIGVNNANGGFRIVHFQGNVHSDSGIVHLKEYGTGLSISENPNIVQIDYFQSTPSETGWPWRWGLRNLGKGLDQLLSKHGFPIPTDNVLAPERRWLLARHIADMFDVVGPHIPSEQVSDFVRFLISSGGDNPMDIVFVGNSDTPFYQFELANMIHIVEEADYEYFTPPWPIPDFPRTVEGESTGIRSPNNYLELVRYSYGTGLKGYYQLIQTYLANWAPTLNWASIMPIRLQMVLDPEYGSGTRHQPVVVYWETLASSEDDIGVDVVLAGDYEGDPLDFDRQRFTSLWEHFRQERPDSSAWAMLTHTSKVLDSIGDTPALDLAVEWLKRDLGKLGLLK